MPTMPMRVRSRRASVLEFVVKAAITLGLLGFLLVKVDLKATVHQVTSIGLGAFALSTAIILALSLLGSIRWKVIFNVMNSPLSLWQCWRLVIIGMFFNQTLPSSIGGDAVRIWLCTQRGKTLRVGFVSVALDRLFALVAVGACVGVALPSLSAGPAALLAIFVSVMAVLGSIGLFGFDAAARWLSPLASRLVGKRFGAIAVRPVDILRDLSRVFALILRRSAAGTEVLGVSVVNQLSLGLVVYVIARALGTDLSLVNALQIFPLAMLLSMVPISLGGWGVREASMVWLFGAVGIHPQEALSISVLFGLATIAAGLPGGLLWLLDRRSDVTSGSLPAVSLGAAAGVPSDPKLVSHSTSKLSPWVTIIERQVDFGDGRVETYHAIDQSDYVAILAVTPDKRIPIVRQYRPALDRFTWELPAGMLEVGEAPETTCIRELLEETGLVGARVHPLGVLVTDSARLCNHIHSFLVETEPTPQSTTELEVRYVTLDELQTLILAGQFDLQYHVGTLGLAFLRPELMQLLK